MLHLYMDPLRAFTKLKALLLHHYQAAYPHYQGGLESFRQRDIHNFQLLLEERVAARVSEKWFYTHLKPTQNEKLPRIDTLDLLARFVGYDSWDAFCHSLEAEPPEKVDAGVARWWWLLLFLLPFGGISWLGYGWLQVETVELCVVDAIRRMPITEQAVQLEIIAGEQSPKYYTSKESGCVDLPTWEGVAQLVISAPYYLADTLEMSYEQVAQRKEIALRTDDYALMIHYFSNSKVADWKRRREQLQEVFGEQAMIYQIDPNGQLGMDILNKNEFINKLTIPINSLQNVAVLQTTYEDGQIVELRFMVKE